LKKPEDSLKVLVIGNDPRLGYLLNRYGDQSGLAMTHTSILNAFGEIQKTNPEYLIFSSLEALRECQGWVSALGDIDIHILVCSAVGDEAAAREMGADECMFHPVTYESFCNALALNCGAQSNFPV